jgi:hypothetical protein
MALLMMVHGWCGIEFPEDPRVRKGIREAFIIYDGAEDAKGSSPFVLVVEHGIGE